MSHKILSSASLTNVPDLSKVPEPIHGQMIAPARRIVKELKKSRQHGLTREERAIIWRQFDAADACRVIEGVDFSRAKLSEILKSYQTGRVQIETMKPSLSDYDETNGRMSLGNLLPEDAIGLKVAADLHASFPKAKLISILDDYAHHSNAGEEPYTLRTVTAFKRSLLRLLKGAGALPENATIGKEYSFIRESDLAFESAPRLIWRLELKQNVYMGEGQTIRFVNEDPENPLLDDAILRTKSGHWLHIACNAASYLKRENLSITHLVVLPDYMKRQQDQMWEILRVLGIQAHKYHNIYYDSSLSPEHVSRVIIEAFDKAKAYIAEP